MGRLSGTEALLGPDLFSKVRETPVLVVGSGGIGCELRE
jgi:ubiquitin-like 1-activating enzyme E1 B